MLGERYKHAKTSKQIMIQVGEQILCAPLNPTEQSSHLIAELLSL